MAQVGRRRNSLRGEEGGTQSTKTQSVNPETHWNRCPPFPRPGGRDEGRRQPPSKERRTPKRGDLLSQGGWSEGRSEAPIVGDTIIESGLSRTQGEAPASPEEQNSEEADSWTIRSGDLDMTLGPRTRMIATDGVKVGARRWYRRVR